MDNILALQADLMNGSYRHGGYQAFNISDPKPRNIHKASVRDRLLHHAIYRVLYPFFDRAFIADSFSCRNGKGKHKALNRFRSFSHIVGKNNTRTCWVLKCDIKKFFANIDHDALIEILMDYIPDKRILALLENIIDSFSSDGLGDAGLPLGNLTSQLFVNIYMNEFDQFIKHNLQIRHYIRYADDFVILSPNRFWLEIILREVDDFLKHQLKLKLHPDKVFIKTLASGVDFLGWIHFPDHRVLRGASRRRMMKQIATYSDQKTLSSYRGLLSHGNGHKLLAQLGDNLI
jgi:retron-type reverse transcriptase